MNEDTIYLLRECNAGCKSATNSMEQVKPYISNEKFMSIINEYNDKHIKLGDECHQMLNEYNEGEKDPQVTAKAFSWISTEMKLAINNDTHKIANIMIDGCNMGIKSVSKYINKYEAASNKSMNLAKKLVKMEQELMNALLEYL
ncbi:MAG: hypothetical protein PHI24_10805 [Desulfitobacteriaceae bacterium]|nr:hypothetical protein [Desulfitobacteriaceae bacterium]